MIIQIIPDIHNKVITAELMIDQANADRIVFLGDYFDDFNDTPQIAYNTAEWLKDSLNKQNRIHLIGNHDIGYMTNGVDGCSGWQPDKQFFVNKVGVPWEKMREYCWVDDWLCSHAGLTRSFMSAYNHKNLHITQFLDNIIENYPYRLRQASPYRGGRDSHSGIFWCDYDEFEDIPNIKQIFGHTHGELRQTENHICLDTWLKYYTLYDTKKKTMEVVKFG